MTQRNNGRKESEFPASTTLPSGAYLTYFANGVNYKIDLSSFQTALSVTGSIVQTGSATGTPVLEKQGAVNRVRNIENGPGIAATVSPQNGLKLSHNFTIDTTGAPLMLNATTNSPTLPSIVGGAGITVTAVGSTIEISLT